MAEKLRKMKGKDFVERLLKGERVFTSIELEERFDLSGFDGFADLQEYLKKQNFENDPIELSFSKVVGLKAVGVHFPCLEAENANLREANFRDANLVNANFWGAYLGSANFANADIRVGLFEDAHLENAYFGGTNLHEAKFVNAKLRYTDFEKANLRGVDFMNANLKLADLRGALHLEAGLNLQFAHYERTRVTLHEKAIILNELAKLDLFVVEER